MDEANRAWNENNINCPGFPVQRARLKKRMVGELQRNDVVGAQTAHWTAYFATIDVVQCELKERLNVLEEIVNIFGFVGAGKVQDELG